MLNAQSPQQETALIALCCLALLAVVFIGYMLYTRRMDKQMERAFEKGLHAMSDHLKQLQESDYRREQKLKSRT